MVPLNFSQANALAELVRQLHQKGHSPATSTNYSFRNSSSPLSIAISQSGVDKARFGVEHWMLIDGNGAALPGYESLRASAETLLHTVLYQENPQIQVVLHSHSLYSALLSNYFAEDKQIRFQGLELLKAFSHIQSHEESKVFPIFENTQDIASLSEQFRSYYRLNPDCLGYLIQGHGFYTWGNSLHEAKRHLEAWDYLLDYQYRSLLLPPRPVKR